MNGLQWTSYTSTLNFVGGKATLYNRAVTFFNSPPTAIKSGSVEQIQINTSNNINNPPISTFTFGQTTNLAIKFNGYFYASQSGNYTFTLGVVADGVNSDIKDYGILFIGLANSNIVPNSTFVENSSLSNIYPIIYTGSEIMTTLRYTATVNLTADNFYPMLFYYNKGSNYYSGGTLNTNHQCGLYFSYAGGSPITDYPGYIYTDIPIIVNGIGYHIIDDTQTVEVIRKGSLYTNTITIPNTVTMPNELEYTVVRIGDSAFSGCSDITIDISSCTSITSIQSNSFSGCISFAIILPSSVISIEDYTFSNSGLTAITLTSSITSIGAYAFENCALTTIALPSSLTSIGDSAFYGCASLTDVTLLTT